MIKAAHQEQEKKYERSTTNPFEKEYKQDTIANENSKNYKNELSFGKKQFPHTSFFCGSYVNMAIGSIGATICILIIVTHLFALPINHQWIYSDPAVIGILNFFALTFLDHRLKITPCVLFVIGVIYNFYPLLYLDGCGNKAVALALSIGIPVYMTAICVIFIFAHGLPLD